MIGEVAAKRTLCFVGLRLVGMEFEPGGWKTVGGPLVDWVALIVAAERCLNKTNNKHHYDVILSLRSGSVKADYARAQSAYSELLSPTQRDKELVTRCFRSAQCEQAGSGG
jgi:hypothetical protein